MGIYIDIDVLRDKIKAMYDSDKTLYEIECYMSDMAIKNDAGSIIWTAYLSAGNQDQWLEDFVDG